MSEEIAPGGRQRLTAGLERAVGIEQLGADHADIGMRVEIARHQGQRARRGFGVGVEEQDIAPSDTAQGDIVAFGKAIILFAGREMNLGKLGRHHRGAVIR